MKTQFRRIAGIALAALLLAACAGGGRGPKETAGAVIGGVGGAVVGSQIGGGTGRIVATAAGTLLGAWLGSEVGRQMDETDRQRAAQTAGGALEREPDGESATWSNPNTGNSGSTTPLSSYETAGGVCRDFQTAAVIDGQAQSATGTACRQSDGTWTILD